MAVGGSPFFSPNGLAKRGVENRSWEAEKEKKKEKQKTQNTVGDYDFDASATWLCTVHCVLYPADCRLHTAHCTLTAVTRRCRLVVVALSAALNLRQSAQLAHFSPSQSADECPLHFQRLLLFSEGALTSLTLLARAPPV